MKMKDSGFLESVFKDLEMQVKDLDESKGIVTIYINSFDNEDTDGDISVKGSFNRTFKNNKKRIRHLLNHNTDKLIGVPIKLYEDDFGAIAKSQLNMEKTISKDVFSDYKLYAEHGMSLEHSVRVNATERDPEDKRRVLEWKLWEYSTLYSWGANENTPLINIKSLDELELMMRKGDYSDEKAKLIEKLYDQLKDLLTGPPGTLETDPPTLVKGKGLLEVFYNQLNMN